MERNINKPDLKVYRKRLRNKATSAEASLWRLLKNKQVAGLKFRRQTSIYYYIVDFYCPEIKLIVELDGASHDNYLSEENDERRDEHLKKEGYHILRFENRYVFEFPEDIIDEILKVREMYYSG